MALGGRAVADAEHRMRLSVHRQVKPWCTLGAQRLSPLLQGDSGSVSGTASVSASAWAPALESPGSRKTLGRERRFREGAFAGGPPLAGAGSGEAGSSCTVPCGLMRTCEVSLEGLSDMLTPACGALHGFRRALCTTHTAGVQRLEVGGRDRKSVRLLRGAPCFIRMWEQ